MSTYWGYVCESHDPPIESDHDLNHGDDALIDLYWKVRNGEWPRSADLVPEFRLAYGDELAPMVMVSATESTAAYAVPVAPRAGGGTPPWHGPVAFLQDHPRCKIALKNEYGDRREIGETIQGSVAPQAIEP